MFFVIPTYMQSGRTIHVYDMNGRCGKKQCDIELVLFSSTYVRLGLLARLVEISLKSRYTTSIIIALVYYDNNCYRSEVYSGHNECT
jgi:hypothetical protein